MNCRWCSNSCKKDGRQKDGTQRFKCKICLRKQQHTYLYKAYLPITQDCFRKFQHFAVSNRLMARYLGISRKTLERWILKGLSLKSDAQITCGGIFEIDELKTYVSNREREVWVTYGWSVKDKEPVGLHVGKRGKEDLNPVVKEVLKYRPEKIKTDGLATYKVLIPKSIHQVGKHLANHIERNHVNLRKNIACLIRRTICYAKSIKMLEARIRWCFWGDSNPDFFLERRPRN